MLVCLIGLFCCRAHCYPSLTPFKDKETVIHGTSLDSPAFQHAVHGVLRILIDKLDVKTFNVGILGMNAVDGDLAADFTDGNSRASSSCNATSLGGVIAR